MTSTPTPQGTVRVCRLNRAITFQVVGWGRMHQSIPVRRITEKCLTEGATTVRVDLRHCTYLDSTFLGTLLLLGRTMQRREGCRLLLVSPSEECCRLFKQMGVEDFLAAVAEEELIYETWTEVACELDNVEAFNHNVVQAHQELADLGGPAGKAFENVARGLAKDLEPGDLP